MATNQSNGQDAGTNTGNSVTESSPDYVFDGTSAAIVVPVGDALLNSEYSRSGPDLFLETPDGKLILITNYFAQDIPPDLFTLAGSRITADVAAKLAGPRAPGQVAQDGDLSTLEEPIGTVETAKGVITVIRADGTQVTLAEGDPLYQGDTLVSGPDSAIGIIFADKSTMSMAANARIILDELVYDPQDTASNSQVFNVIQGAFMFTSGAIGKSDPEDVSVNTPVATIGIRGTKFGVSVDALDGSTNVTIFEGAVFVQNGAGNVLLTGIGETTLIPSYSLPPSDPERLPLEEIQRLYGDAIGFHPVRQEIPDDHASADDDDLQDIAGDLDDIETAAGGNQQGGEGANNEFGEIGNQGLGGSGLGGTPLGTGGEGDGEGGPFTSGGGSSTGGGVEGEGEGGSPFGGETVETLEIGEGVLGDDDIIRFSSPPLSSGTNYTVSAPLGEGTQQLGLDASGLGGDAGASLTLQSGSAPDSVYPAKQSTVLSSTDGMNLTINGFEELAITLGSGSDTVEIGDLSDTSIDPDTVTIFAGDGADIIRTTDTTTGTKLVVDAGDGDDFVIGSELNDEISGGAGNDTIQGGAGDDSVSGGTGNDILVGATGNDILEGNEDDDQLFGFGGDDTLLGGSGDDLLEGGSGSDVVDGGEGDDRAIFIVGQEQTEGVNDAYDGGANTQRGGDTIVISFDTEVLDNPVFRQAILDIYAMLGNAASGSPEEFDTAPFQALGLDIQNFESVELDGPSFALLLENGLAVEEDGSVLLNLAVTEVLSGKSVSVSIGDLNGASLVDNDGNPVGTDNGDGTFTLTVEQLDGLTLKPAADSDVDLNLSVTVTTVDEFGNEESIGDNLDVAVTGVADEPTLAVSDSAGIEDSAIALNIDAALTDLDGSETLTVTITGVPTGATLSAGTALGDGAFVLTAEELDGLTITPALDSTLDFTLGVSATATEADGDTTTTSNFDIAVSVTGTPQVATLVTTDTSGLEGDEAIGLTISVTDIEANDIVDSIVITGVPDDASLSAGEKNEDGSYTLTLADLEGLTITPPQDSNEDIELTVAVTTKDIDSGETETATDTLTVALTGVADQASLTVSAAGGAEDTAIALTISTALTDTDGSEEITEIRISNIPNGAILSAGTLDEETGDVILTEAELAGLTITPPVNLSGDFALSVSVTTQENDGDTATRTEDLTVSVAGVADAPVLTVGEALGLEDQAIDLDISAALTDASETLSDITISGLNGATLNAGTVNEDGSVTLTAAELDGLQITPAANFSGDLTLSVSVTSTDGESEATTTKDLTVSITGVADAPELTVAEALGLEDQAIDLDISAALTDASETLSDITISGLNGATLNAGTVNEDGSVTLTASELDGLQITPAANFSGDLTLSVSVTSTDGESEATTTKDLTVSIAGTADAPVLTVAEALGLEDQAIDLDISAALTDASETLSDITISGLNGATLNAGTVNEDGSVTLTAAELDGLQITPAANFSGDLTLSVSVTSTDGESEATTTKDLTVSIAGVADAPELTVGNALGLEDQAIDLDISAALTDASETLSDVTISGLNGATLNAGTVNEDGSVTLTAAELDGLQITPAANFSGDLTLSVSVTSTDGESEATTTKDLTVSIAGVADAPELTVAEALGLEDQAIDLDISAALTDASETLSDITISGLNGATLNAGTVNEDGSVTLTAAELDGLQITPAANFSGDLTLSVSVTSTDGESEATTTKDLTVSIAGVADAPELTVAEALGLEDQAIDLDISAALTDASETLSDITISGLNGATLNAGTVNEDGSVTLTAAELDGLQITPAANFSGDLTLSVSVTSTDGESEATTTKDLTVSIAGVADDPVLTVAEALGLEDQAIDLDISAALTDASETLSDITISGLNGATLNAGTVNEDGSVTLTASELDGLQITPAANFSGDLTLAVSVTSTDGESEATTTKDLSVSIAGVADAPVLTVGEALGLEDQAIDLDISAALTDESETLSDITISGLNGATLNAGTVNEDGSVTLTAAELDGLQITPAANFSGDLTLSVSVTSTDGESEATTTKDLTVSIAGVADAPVLTVAEALGLEDQAIDLDISAALTDASETLSDITISGLNGATLNAGTVNEDGSVTLTAAELDGLQITPAANFSGNLTLSVSVTSTDGESEATTTKDLKVSVTGVADAPVLTADDVATGEDTSIELNIGAFLTDASEDLSEVTISNFPPGTTFSAGVVSEGVLTISAGELAGLTMTPPNNFSGDIDLTASVSSQDGEGSETTTTTNFTVTVEGIADAPELTVGDVTGDENTAIALNLSAALTDTDGSETLTVEITGLPAGATLSAGTVDRETGAVTLTAAELEDLTLIPALGSIEDFTLSVTATATEDNGDTATTVGSINITVEGIAGEATLVLSDAEGIEDVDIPLTINVTGVQENDTAQVTISNIPIGASLSSGTIINGVAILTIAQLANLTITPPANSNEDFDLTVTVTTTDNESGEERSVSDVVTVGVTGDADAPVLTVGNAIGAANSAIALNIESSLQDLDGSESLTLTITGLPEGATLVNATGNPIGTEVSDGVFSVPDSQLGNLFVLPPEGSTETITLTVTATATENDGDTESVSKVLTVDITGTAGEAVVTVTDAAGLEDTAIPLAISVGEIEADDTATITLSGIPTGAVLKDGNGTIIVSVDGLATLSQADLAGLTITPPPNSDSDFELTVTVVTEDNASGQQATVTETIAVAVTADADAPLLDVANVTGSEDTDIPLSLSAALGDLDGSEILTGITITGLPEGATLSAGAVQPDGSVLLTVEDLQGLTIRPPPNFSGDIQLAISATALDGIIDSSEASASFTVTVSGVADTPTLELNDTAGNLAAQIPVDISSTLTDLDGSEELTVTISGLNGAILSAGTLNDDGTVTLSADELTGLTITPVPNTSGSIELTVTATATEADGDTASVSGTVTIAVADSSTVVLVPGQDLDLVAPESSNPSDTQKLVLDAGFGGATTGDDWIIAQDDFGRVTLTNTLTGQLVTADGYEEIDIDFGPGEDTVELRDLSNTDLSNNTLTLNLGDGNDTVTAGEDVNRNVEIYGGAGNDDLQGSNGADLIDGGAGDDILSGGAGDDDLDGGEGSDKYLWSEGDGVDAYGDTGTEGIDTIVAQTTRFEGIADGFNAGQSGIEAIGWDSDGDGNVDTGSPLLIALSDSSETVDFSGLDFLNSQTTVDLGDGNDTVTTAVGDGDAVTYTGGEGQDTLNLLLTAESLNQMISAGQLALLQSYIASPDNAVLTLTTPNIVAQGFETVRIGILGEDGSVADVTDALSNAISDNIGLGQIILGTNDPDLVFAGDGNDIVRSFSGEDVLFGGAGEDYLNAGADDDYVDGGTGNDIIDGGSGNDRLLGGEGADLVSGGQGDDDISGGAGNDFLAGFQGDDTIKGDAGDDFLAGGSGQDSLYGGDGNDRLVGGSGDDFLIGGSGIDSLDGESGNDVLIADDFEDQLFGGTGDDLLVSTMDELPTSRVSDGAQGNFAGVRDGGEGEDTFRLDSDEFGPHTLSGDQFSNIRNIETLDLSGVDQLQLSLRVEDIVTMTDEDNDLTILLGENVTSVEIDEETIQLENGQAIFEQDGVHIVLQQQQPPPEAS